MAAVRDYPRVAKITGNYMGVTLYRNGEELQIKDGDEVGLLSRDVVVHARHTTRNGKSVVRKMKVPIENLMVLRKPKPDWK